MSGAAQRLDMPQALARRQQLAFLRLVGRCVVDLPKLEREQVELTLACARKAREVLERLLGGPDVRMGLRARRASRRLVGAAERVEQLELSRGERQPAVLVLAVEREQRRRSLAQIRHIRGAPVDQRPRAPIGADSAREDQLVRVLREPVAEPGAHLIRQVEDPLDVRLRRSRPHDSGPRLAAEQQIQRMREHRLARTGLTREHVQPGREQQLGAVDQQQVLNSKLAQHGIGDIRRGGRSWAFGAGTLDAHQNAPSARSVLPGGRSRRQSRSAAADRLPHQPSQGSCTGGLDTPTSTPEPARTRPRAPRKASTGTGARDRRWMTGRVGRGQYVCTAPVRTARQARRDPRPTDEARRPNVSRNRL